MPTDYNHDYYMQSAAAISPSIALTDSIGMYVEYFVIYPPQRHENAAQGLGAGFTFLLSKNIQLDIQATYGLSDRDQEAFSVGGGIALRW